MVQRAATASVRQTRSEKHRSVALLLDDMLNRLIPGGKLPGIRALMQLSGCGRPLVETELGRLVREGKISVRTRSGYFKRGESASRRKILLLHKVVYPGTGKNFVDILFDVLRERIEKEQYEFCIINFVGRKQEFFQHLAETSGTDKAFLFGCDSNELSEAVHQTFRFCMELLPRHDAVLGAEVRDSSEMTVIQLNYLFRLNYRKIGYFHHVEPEYSRTPVEYHRLFDYYRIMAERGLQVKPSWVLFAPWEWDEFEQAMEIFFSSGDVPEAVIIPGSTLPFFYRYCGNRGIEIGKDIGVMGCDSFCSDLHPQVTTTTNDPLRIAEDAWQVMKELLAGNVLSRTTTLHVLPRASIILH